MNYYLAALKKYAVFEGRANWEEFWYFVLFDISIAIVIHLLGWIFNSGFFLITLYSLYSLAMMIPRVSVAVRRLHDIGKSGWMILIGLVPLIGYIWLIVLWARKGDVGDNKYGKEEGSLENNIPAVEAVNENTSSGANVPNEQNASQEDNVNKGNSVEADNQ